MIMMFFVSEVTMDDDVSSYLQRQRAIVYPTFRVARTNEALIQGRIYQKGIRSKSLLIAHRLLLRFFFFFFFLGVFEQPMICEDGRRQKLPYLQVVPEKKSSPEARPRNASS